MIPIEQSVEEPRGVRRAGSGLYTLARLIAELPADPDGVAADDPLRDIVRRVADCNGAGPREAFAAAVADRPDAAELIELVLGVDPMAEHQAPRGQEQPPIPELPRAARPDLELARDAGAWVDVYARHARSVSPMTPDLFHESAALWLGSTAIARRLKVPLSFADIYPNLYIVWVAVTTIFHKTTAMDVARLIARDLFPHLLAPQDVTPEAFLSDLAGVQPAKYDDMSEAEQVRWHQERNFAGQRSLALDEVSGLMAGTGKDYNAGLLEAFLRFYDCDPWFTRSTRSQGRVTVRNAYVSMLGASTPRAMAQHLSSERLWAMGWWPRFALLSPDIDRPAWKKPTAQGGPGDAVLHPLRGLYSRLPAASWPEPAAALPVALGAGVFEKWEAYNKALSHDLLTPDLDDALWGTYGRLPTQAVKVATILAALDWRPEEAPRIELPHLHRAIGIVEAWRASAHRTLALAAVADENVRLSRLVRQVARAGLDGVSLRDLGRAMIDVPAGVLRQLVEHAVEAGEIAPMECPAGPKGGRPTKRYRIPIE